MNYPIRQRALGACLPFPLEPAPRETRRPRDPGIDRDGLGVVDLARHRRQRETEQRWAAMCSAFRGWINLNNYGPEFVAQEGGCFWFIRQRTGGAFVQLDMSLSDAEIDAALAIAFAAIARGESGSLRAGGAR